MPECAFHPGVDTNVACVECERWICPKDMVPTPVGYKCPICARPEKGQLRFVKPRQWVLGAAAAAGVAILGAIFFRLVGTYFFFLVPLAFGMLVGEATRRGSGGHRGAGLAAIAGVSAAIGGFAGGLGLLGTGLAVLGAVAYLLQNRI